MGFREYLGSLESSGRLLTISKPVSRKLEAAAILNELGDRPVLFDKVRESKYRIAGNLFGTKSAIADYFGVQPAQLIPRMVEAIRSPHKPEEVSTAPCQECVMEEVDLDQLPILFHCEQDGGRYISSGVFITRSREGIQNLDFHRAMQLGRNRFSVRIVRQRNFDELLNRDGELPVAVCVGNAPNVLLAAAISVPLGQNELEIANSLEPLRVVRASTFAGLIPADAEFVLEGIVRRDERANEGPFVDLTGTYDFVREEPVLEVKLITHRRDPVWQALLPGKLEHKILMGMPREPTIFKEVNDAEVECLDVNVNPGGCSWLHALVKIRKRHEDDGRKAIAAAFRGHKSCKHVFVFDEDIDIYNPAETEWALATRFQADRDFVLHAREKGSSLDPSADAESSVTQKCGFDCTKPLVTGKKHFTKAAFPKVNLQTFLG